MAETGNAIISVTDITDIQTRLAQVEAALGRTNLVSAVDGFSFIDGNPSTGTGPYGIGNIKIYCQRIPFTNFTPGDNLSYKYQLDLANGTFAAGYKDILTFATPVIICSDNNEWAKIKASASVRKFSAAAAERAADPGTYSVVLNSDSSANTVATWTGYVDFMAIALYY